MGLIFSCFFLLPAFADEPSDEELRAEMVESVEDLRRTEDLTATAIRARKDKRGWLFDYGSNFSSNYSASDDNDRNPVAQDDPDHTWDHEIQLFGLVTTVDRNFKFYGRTKAKRTDNAKFKAGTKENDVQKPKIDMLYVERTFQGAALKSKLTFGRQFGKVGRGIAFGLTADGILWNSKGKKMEATAMLLRQNPGDNNIDNFSPGSGRTKRMFFGLQVQHKFKKWLGLTVFSLWNKDRNSEASYVTGAGQTQRSIFNSEYYGLGFDGTFFSSLNYWSEFIVVRGKTYNAASATNLTASKVGVDADAFDLGLRYLFGGDIAPTLFAEYAVGSGDADRGSNVTSSRAGSSFGKDSVFRSFGGLPMGHSLAPSLSNIRILKAGCSFKPFGRWGAARWEDMTVNLTAYTYWAAAKGGPTSDPFIYPDRTGARKSLGSNDIGDEYDMTLSWKFFDDVNYQFKYGYFMPGPAYGSTRGREHTIKMKVSFDL